MTNFEYLIMLLEDDEELVEKINSMESEYMPELSNIVYDSIDSYYDCYEENNITE